MPNPPLDPAWLERARELVLRLVIGEDRPEQAEYRISPRFLENLLSTTAAEAEARGREEERGAAAGERGLLLHTLREQVDTGASVRGLLRTVTDWANYCTEKAAFRTTTTTSRGREGEE